MELKPYQRKILDMHLEIELLMAELYSQFANTFTEYHDFWIALSQEEKQHASWLDKLLEGIDLHKVRFDEGKTRTYTLDTVLKYLRSTKIEFETKPFDIVRAASFVRDFENSLIDKNLFKHFEGDSDKARVVISKLAEAQKTHVERIESAIGNILSENKSSK